MDRVPAHIGIIMDGNGRWAEARGRKRSYGHKAGSKNVETIVSHAFRRGVNVVTVYAFSSENWARPKDEVDELMRLLGEYITKLSVKAVKNKIKIRIIGDMSALSENLTAIIARETAKTAQFEDYILNICINYGGRQEIVAAVNALLKEGAEITAESIAHRLYTAGLPELDLIIRTGGEIRLSNFMMYQSAYSELYFTDVLWPDFNAEEFDKALAWFATRKRRYGKI